MPNPRFRYAALEFDSMDQEKCSLPHFPRDPKVNDGVDLVKMHVTAVRVEGIAVLEYVYTNNFAHDANTTVTVLHKYVRHFFRHL